MSDLSLTLLILAPAPALFFFLRDLTTNRSLSRWRSPFKSGTIWICLLWGGLMLLVFVLKDLFPIA